MDAGTDVILSVKLKIVTLDDEMHRQASWPPGLSENYMMINELKNS
jgi:hypothetical protein